MRRKIRRLITNCIIVTALIIIASLALFFHSGNIYFERIKEVFVILIYQGLLAYWALGIMKRIMNVRVRRYMLAMAFLMMLWIIFRSLRWYVITDPLGNRILWYLYYLPQLFIIYNNFMISEWLSTRDRVRQKRDRNIVFSITSFLAAMVLSNEFHNFVFIINKTDNTSTHYIGYYLLVIWMLGLILHSVIRLSRNTHKAGFDKRIIAPVFVMVVGVIYCILILVEELLGRPTFLEYTAGFSLLTICFMESLIQTGLIPSNIDYDWCFNHSSVKAQILDKNGNKIYESIEARSLTSDEVAALMNGGRSKVDDNVELVSAPIKGGYVVWENNVKDINYSILKLNEMKRALSEATQTLEANISVENKHQEILAQNRLYDITFVNVEKRLTYLELLLNLAKEYEGDNFRKVIEAIDLIGVYVKRKSNLLLLSEQLLDDFTEELRLCFKESFDNLRDMGYVVSFMFMDVSGLDYETADLIYDTFETILEGTLDSVKSVNLILSASKNGYVLTVNENTVGKVKTEQFLPALQKNQRVYGTFEEDGDEFTTSFLIRKEEK